MSRPAHRSINRRNFLFTLGAGTAASVLRPPLAGSAQGPKGDPVIVGSGAHRYEWVKGWGTLPDGMKLGSMHGGVAVDSQNLVYVTTDGDGSIVVFDPDGKFVRAIGKEWIPDKEGAGTHDIQVHREGGQDYIYIVSLFRHEFAKLTTARRGRLGEGLPGEVGHLQVEGRVRAHRHHRRAERGLLRHGRLRDELRASLQPEAATTSPPGEARAPTPRSRGSSARRTRS